MQPRYDPNEICKGWFHGCHRSTLVCFTYRIWLLPPIIQAIMEARPSLGTESLCSGQVTMMPRVEGYPISSNQIQKDG